MQIKLINICTEAMDGTVLDWVLTTVISYPEGLVMNQLGLLKVRIEERALVPGIKGSESITLSRTL